MKNISVKDTLSLSIPERIQLVEDIWDSIAAEAESIELTDDEKKLLVLCVKSNVLKFGNS